MVFLKSQDFGIVTVWKNELPLILFQSEHTLLINLASYHGPMYKSVRHFENSLCDKGK